MAKIKTLNELIAVAIGVARAQLDRKIHAEAAIRYGLIAALFIAAGIPAPAIISGFRTLSDQKKIAELRGNVGRPVAKRSWHTVGLAFDLDHTNAAFPLFASLWKALGGRDGRDFSTPDPGHLDFPVNSIQPAAAF